jgi:H+/Cl- antiporter ClcA
MKRNSNYELSLFIEAVVIGLLLGVFGLFFSTLLMFITSSDFKLSKYHFWWKVLLSYIFIGFLFHIFCEVTHINKWYCKNGHACHSR